MIFGLTSPITAPSHTRPFLAPVGPFYTPNLRFASSYTIQLTPTAGPTFIILGNNPLYSPLHPSFASVWVRTSRKPVYACG